MFRGHDLHKETRLLPNSRATASLEVLLYLLRLEHAASWLRVPSTIVGAYGLE